MQVFPPVVSSLFNTWELSLIVLFSFFLQLLLTPMGLKRKCSSSKWLRLLLLFAYLSAHWAATVSLGILSNIHGGESVSDELKRRIFEQLKLKLEVDEESRKLPGWILRRRNCFDKLGWSLELDLDQSILLWHIATDLCYHSDHETIEPSDSSILEDSKSLSNFLAYLVAYRHWLFPNGMVHIRFRAIVEEAIAFLREESITTAGEACESMLVFDSNHIVDHLPTNVEEDEENGVNSLFYHGCRLALELQGLEECERWEIIIHVWVEMLSDISCGCRWYDHIEQLAHGGDLLTHVWLLMHHLGYIK